MSSSALRRYYKILDGEEEARYLQAKRQVLSLKLDEEDHELWQAHNLALAHPPLQPDRGVSLLDLKSEIARRMLSRCSLCERRCGANRAAGERGHCGVLEARICSEFLHFGEEPDLVPSYTVFFAGCTLNCVFCQNWDISTRPDAGAVVKPSALSKRVELICSRGSRPYATATARNVNWVGGDPTSNLPYILEVLRACNANIPQVWNSNMYLTEESMRLLDGVIDVYLTDYKYGNDACAERLSNASNYTSIIQRNHLYGRRHAEMIIRHLVLPGHVDCCTRPALSWIADNLKDVKVNVMGQYRPEHRAREIPKIAAPLRIGDYRKALEIAERLGLDLCD
jgi:putative pyruvate formate lyase activating enzyme